MRGPNSKPFKPWAIPKKSPGSFTWWPCILAISWHGSFAASPGLIRASAHGSSRANCGRGTTRKSSALPKPASSITSARSFCIARSGRKICAIASITSLTTFVYASRCWISCSQTLITATSKRSPARSAISRRNWAFPKTHCRQNPILDGTQSSPPRDISRMAFPCFFRPRRGLASCPLLTSRMRKRALLHSRHLRGYLTLFRQVSEFRFLFLSATDLHFAKASELFRDLVITPLEPGSANDLLRYFTVRKAWELGQYDSVTEGDLIFRNAASERFGSARFEHFYR